MKKSACILSLAVFIVLVFACSQPNTSPADPETQKVFSPTFLDVPLPQTGKVLIEANRENMAALFKPVFYFGYTPVISKFENRSISLGNTYSSVSLFDEDVPIKYEKQEDGKLLFSGVSAENDIYISTLYSPDTNSYDYKQALVVSLKEPGTSSQTDRINIIKGENISIDATGNSHGTTRFYFVNVYPRGKQFSIGDAEFFSNELISGAAAKFFVSCSTSSSPVEGEDARIADLNPTLDDIDKIIALGDELYESHKGDKQDFPTPNDYYALLYYDKQTGEVTFLGVDDVGNSIVSEGNYGYKYMTKAIAQEDATRISNGEWTLL
ncbi:MAG: hypothetical protein SPD11_14215 [Sphaerochaetaceae bacterium]|nr:hypothetical protein [Sphaerochaetaceae bacterium]